MMRGAVSLFLVLTLLPGCAVVTTTAAVTGAVVSTAVGVTTTAAGVTVDAAGAVVDLAVPDDTAGGQGG